MFLYNNHPNINTTWNSTYTVEIQVSYGFIFSFNFSKWKDSSTLATWYAVTCQLRMPSDMIRMNSSRGSPFLRNEIPKLIIFRLNI